MYNWKASWATFPDGKHYYFRSRWEYVFAQYLQNLKEKGVAKEWWYEPRTFWFEGIRRGVCSYKPDFLVDFGQDQRSWYEVKGYMDRRSIVKLKRFLKFYPQERIMVIGKSWFDRYNLNKNIFLNPVYGDWRDNIHKLYAKVPAMKKKEEKDKKIEKVMTEFKEEKLHSGSKKGPVVKDKKQAVAIAMNEAGKSKKGKK